MVVLDGDVEYYRVMPTRDVLHPDYIPILNGAVLLFCFNRVDGNWFYVFCPYGMYHWFTSGQAPEKELGEISVEWLERLKGQTFAASAIVPMAHPVLITHIVLLDGWLQQLPGNQAQMHVQCEEPIEGDFVLQSCLLHHLLVGGTLSHQEMVVSLFATRSLMLCDAARYMRVRMSGLEKWQMFGATANYASLRKLAVQEGHVMLYQYDTSCEAPKALLSVLSEVYVVPVELGLPARGGATGECVGK